MIRAVISKPAQELYEPLWEDLYRQLKKLGLSVRSIWIADAVHQGMSSVLNEEKLGDDRELLTVPFFQCSVTQKDHCLLILNLLGSLLA